MPVPLIAVSLGTKLVTDTLGGLKSLFGHKSPAPPPVNPNRWPDAEMRAYLMGDYGSETNVQIAAKSGWSTQEIDNMWNLVHTGPQTPVGKAGNVSTPVGDIPTWVLVLGGAGIVVGGFLLLRKGR